MINYDLPNNRELYIHRIGRSGRFGRKVFIPLCIVDTFRYWPAAWLPSVQDVYNFSLGKIFEEIILFLTCKIEQINNMLTAILKFTLNKQ